MAFNRDYMSRAGGGPNAPGLFTYKTMDALTVVDASGYFGGTTDGQTIASTAQIGDTIFVTVVTNMGASNEALADAGNVVVITNASGVVDTTDETVQTITDSR